MFLATSERARCEMDITIVIFRFCERSRSAEVWHKASRIPAGDRLGAAAAWNRADDQASDLRH
jgi:hypothetical protein